MTFAWSKRASKSFSNIKSIHFSSEETAQYKLQLLQRICDKILKTRRLFASEVYHNAYYIRIDNYVVTYEISEDQTLCTIIAFKHMRQQ